MICGSNDSSLTRELGGDYLRISSCGRFWPSGGPTQGSDQGDSWLSYRNSRTKETCHLYWPSDETRTEGSKEKIQWRLKQLCRVGGKWERKKAMTTNKQTVSSGSEDPCSPFLFLVLSMPHRALSPFALLMVFGQRQTDKTNPWFPGRTYPTAEAGLAPTKRREGRILSTDQKQILLLALQNSIAEF